MKELGSKLKKRREDKDISLEKLQEMTKIRKVYLLALEEGNEKKLPGEAYLKGFLKSYAQAVGLNPEEILKEYLKIQNKDEEGVEREEIEEMIREKPRFAPVTIHLIIIVVILAIILFSVFNIMRLNNDDETLGMELVQKDPQELFVMEEKAFSTLDEVKKEDVEKEEKEDKEGITFFLPYFRDDFLFRDLAENKKEEATSKIKESSVILALKVIDRSWVRVTADGQEIFQGFLNSNEEWAFEGEKEIHMRVGNAGGLLRRDREGNYTIPLGSSGEVRDLLFTAENTF